MAGKRWESKLIINLKNELAEAEKDHDDLAKEIVKENPNSKLWEELVEKYMRLGDKMYEIKKKLENLKDTGKINGLPDDIDQIDLGEDFYKGL